MRCISPIRIRNPSKYDFKRRWKPFIDVPCGKCLYCLQRRSNNFAFRIACELKCSKFNPLFVTLTYNEDFIPIAYPPRGSDFSESDIPESDFYFSRGGSTLPDSKRQEVCSDKCRSVLRREDFTRFLKRFRTKVDLRLRYFGCGEYGSPVDPIVGRPHFHFIIWSHDGFISISDLYRAIVDSWHYGFVTIRNVSSAHVHYVAKYCCGKFFTDNPFSNNKSFRPFIACSKGLGKCFLTTQMKKYIFDNLGNFTYLPINGEKFSLPRYIKDSLGLSIDQKEKYLNALLEYGIENDVKEFEASQSYSSVGSMRVDKYEDFVRSTKKKLQKRNL